VGQIFLKCEKNPELFFQGTCVYFKFRVIAKFNRASEFGEKKRKKNSFWA
jgi:hypothetical protein